MKKMMAFVLVLILMMTCAMPAMAAENDSAYRTLYSSEISSLNYLTTATTSEFAVAANVIDTLVEYDRYGEFKGSLAETWKQPRQDITWDTAGLYREGA